ncbi:MAG: nucleotidyltransferase family protein [Maricaulaceae bacterium]
MIDDIKVIILAAGLSRRMGDVNKLLIEIDGVPMVRRAAELYRSLFSTVTVVTGFEAERIETSLMGLDVTVCFNPNFETGQQSSVHYAVMKDNESRKAVMIALADQPFLTRSNVSDFAQDFLASGRSKIYIPFYKLERGNPVIFPRTVLQGMRQGPNPINGRKYIRDNPYHVHKYKAPTEAFITDIDTGDDLDLL